jgi:hypothetical protein
MLEQDQSNPVPTLGTDKQMSQISGEIVDEAAVVQLVDEYVVIFGFGPAV